MSSNNVIQLTCDICGYEKIHCEVCNDVNSQQSFVSCCFCNGKGMYSIGNYHLCDKCKIKLDRVIELGIVVEQ